jgi:hypothetical protein
MHRNRLGREDLDAAVAFEDLPVCAVAGEVDGLGELGSVPITGTNGFPSQA